MAESWRRFQDQRIDLGHRVDAFDGENRSRHTSSRPAARASHTSEATVSETPPIDIPTPTENVGDEGPLQSSDSSIDLYLLNRRPSVSFNKEVRLESGHSQSMAEPLERPSRVRQRGRSILQELADERKKASRAHSESDRTHFDPVTGRHLPKYSDGAVREHARIGEGRFPLLQSTVDALARESQTDLPNAMSLTSEPTLSPTSDAIQTPQDERQQFILSPTTSFSIKHASSYEEPGRFRRTASQRWRDGERASSFFARANPQRSLSSEKHRADRRSTVGSIKSPHSAASSFLRGFSMSSGGDEKDDDTSLECDDEGQTIGDDYVLGKQIGFGGFSVIKEVTQMQANGVQRKLAAKIVRRQIEGKSEVDNEQAQAEFEHEVELWRFLNHPRILPLEAVIVTDEATFCFIPLNTGGTLFDLLRSNRQGLDPDLAQKYTHQLASALRYLHCDARVVHRDIKLENILLDNATSSFGNLRLCDFGMAEWISQDYDTSGPPSPRFGDADRPPQKAIGPADTSTSAFAGGSLDYAAPEIIKIARALDQGAQTTERGIVSPAVDIWALGVCVFAMMVGSRPFSNAFQPRMVMSILAGDWERDELQSKGGTEVLGLVEGCLEMAADERLSIGEVLDCQWLRDIDDESERQEERASAWRL